MKKISIRYGADQLSIDIPEERLLDEAGMREVEPAQDPEAVIETALDHPYRTDLLEKMARGSRNVVILVDDLTRPTPVYRILPSIIRRLEAAGVGREAITILVATGTHRPMTREELAAKVGAATLDRYPVVNHDYRIQEDQVDLGVTPSGIPITINKLVTRADFVIAVGNIVPHRYCGWAGGAKIIQPGIGGEATTAGTHLMITKDPGARLGVVENQVRHEMEAVADRTSLKFIVNTILDRYGNIVDVVAGDYRLAFRKGVEKARKVYTAPVKGLADVVLASAYPSDINLWQAGKSLYSADLVVQENGIIILASPCYEGVGEHGEFVNALQYRYDDLDRMIREGKVKDRVGAAAALAVTLVLARAQVWLVTDHITDEQAGFMNMRRFSQLQQAVDEALMEKGESARISILHEATEILPVIE